MPDQPGIGIWIIGATELLDADGVRHRIPAPADPSLRGIHFGTDNPDAPNPVPATATTLGTVARAMVTEVCWVCLGVEEIKNGDNTGYIGQDGKVISGFDITEDGASVPKWIPLSEGSAGAGIR